MNSHPIAGIVRTALLGTVAFGLCPLFAALQRPVAIHQRAPAYDARLRLADQEGAVVISYTITEKGEAINPAIISSTREAFEAPTLAAVEDWSFRPAMRNGKPVAVRVVQLISYKLPKVYGPETMHDLVAELHLRDANALPLHQLALNKLPFKPLPLATPEENNQETIKSNSSDSESESN